MARQEDKLVVAVVHRSVNRVNLFMGGDREMVLVTGLVAGALIFSSFTLFAVIVGLFIWFVGIRILRLMAKADPLMRFVYLRQLRYKNYYPARASIYRMGNGKAGRKPY